MRPRATPSAVVYCTAAGVVIHRAIMKTLTVRLPETLVADIEAESRTHKVSKSDVVRARLSEPHPSSVAAGASALDQIRDLIGTVEGFPRDLSGTRSIT